MDREKLARALDATLDRIGKTESANEANVLAEVCLRLSQAYAVWPARTEPERAERGR